MKQSCVITLAQYMIKLLMTVTIYQLMIKSGKIYLLIVQSRNRPIIGHTIGGFHVNVQLSAVISVASSGPIGFPGTSVTKAKEECCQST